VLGRIQAREQGSQHGANRTRVDPAIGEATNILLEGADVQTGAAAQAVQGLTIGAAQDR
jgi:hypothetical protein